MRRLFPPLEISDDLRPRLAAVRRAVLNQLTVVTAIFAFINLAVNAFITLTAGRLGDIPLYLLFFGLLLLLALNQRWPYALRAGGYLALIYVLSLFYLMDEGIDGAARLTLVTLVVFALVLTNLRLSLVIGGVVGVTWYGAAVLYTRGLLPPPAPTDITAFGQWVDNSLNLLLFVVALALPYREFLQVQTAAIATSLEKTELEAARAELQHKTEQLETAARETEAVNLKLQEQSHALERRAAQLALSAEVARVAASLHDLSELLATVVKLISERFDFYHVGLFLADEAGEWAVLRAANSEGGRRMLARQHRLRIGQQGIVGNVIATGQPRIAQNVGGDVVHFINPDLPDTQSEMALPLIARAVSIGALDVQSTALNAFGDEDVRTLQTLANQIAVAIENARLFETTQHNLEELRALQRTTRRQATFFTASASTLAYRYDGVTVQTVPGQGFAPADFAPRFTEDRLRLPLSLGQETLGALDIQRLGEAWSSDDVELTEAIANRLALALENARLFEQAQGRAEQMATLSEVALEFTGPQFSLPHLLDLIARRAMHLLRADGAGLWLPAGADEIELRVWHDIHGTELAGRRLPRYAGLGGQAFQTGQIIRVDDYATWAGRVELFTQQVGVQAALAVPMRWQQETLGALTFSHFAAGARFTAEDERIASLFATQAAAALENARLLQETQQRIAELATLNTIGQVAASQMALNTLLDTVGDQIFGAFRVDSGYIALYDAESNQIEFPYTLDAGEHIPSPPMPLGEGLSSIVLQTRQPLLVNRDTARRMAELGAQVTGQEAKSYLAVPLVVGEQAIGLISLQDLETEGRFDESDVRLLTTIAANIGAAIQNARLFEETQRRVAELAAINTISEATTGQLELRAMLELVGDKILQAFAPADGGYIALYDARSNTIEIPYFFDAGQRIVVPPLPLGRGISSVIIQTRRPILVNQNTERQLAALGAQVTGQPSLSYLGVPMIVGDEVVGVMSVQSLTQEGLFTQSDLRLLTTIAANVGTAVQNARLFTQTQTALAENRTLFQISRALAQVNTIPQILSTVVAHALPAGADHAFIVAFHHNTQGEVIELEIAGFCDAHGQYSAVGQRIPPLAAPRLAGISHEPLLLSDVAADPALDTLTRYTLSQFHIRVAYLLPLVAGGQRLGLLAASAQQSVTFAPESLPLLQTTADQVAVTMEKLRLLDETERRAQQLSTLNELSRAVSGLLDREAILRALLRALRQALPLDTFFVTLHNADLGLFTFPLYFEGGVERTVEDQRADQTPLSYAVLQSQQPRLWLRTAAEVEDVRLKREQVEDPNKPSGSLMFVPLVVGAHAIGVISTQTYALNAYTIDHLRLLEGAAGQAAIALENARLFAETQRRADQLTTAAEVSRASISVLDPDELIIQTVDLIRARFDLYYTALFLVDEDRQWARLRYATGTAGRTLMERGHKLEVGGHSMIGQAVAQHSARIALDVGLEPVRFANPLLPDTRSELALPLAVGDVVIGALSVQSTQANAFSPTDLTILQTMADQIAVALQNAQLFAAARQHQSELATLLDAAQAVSSSLDLDDVLGRLAGSLTEALRADHCSMSTFNPQTRVLQTQVEYVRPGQQGLGDVGATFVVDDYPSTVRLLESGEHVIVRGNDPEAEPNEAALLRQFGDAAVLILPLRANQRPVGLVEVYTRDPAHVFTPIDIRLARTLTEQASVAIQNAQLYDSAQRELMERKRAEEELRKFRLGIERADEVIFITDTNGVIVYANPAFEKTYGYTAAEALGQTPRILKSGALTPEAYAQFWELLLSKQAIHHNELLNKTKDGRLIPVEAAANPILDEAGNLLGFLAIQRDITERRQSEAALNYERDLLRTLLDNVPDKIYFKDEQSRFIRASQAVARQFGLMPEQLVGKSDFDFFTPEHAQQALADERELLRTGQNVIGKLERETWPDRPDTWVLTSKLVMRDAEGAVIGSFGISRDVTELKRAQDEAQRRAQLLATAAEVGRAATSTLDLDALLRTSVNLIRDRFGFYHAALFLVDPKTNMAVVREATGEAGRALMTRKHALSVGSRSLVGQATGTRQAVVVQDVTSDPHHLKNPLLPDTRAEAVLPLVSGDRVVGALDVQSATPDAFTPEDLSILATIADQLAVAVQNANLFDRTARQARREKLVVDITSKIRAAGSVEAMLQTAVSELRQALGVSHGAVRLNQPEEHSGGNGHKDKNN